MLSVQHLKVEVLAAAAAASWSKQQHLCRFVSAGLAARVDRDCVWCMHQCDECKACNYSYSYNTIFGSVEIATDKGARGSWGLITTTLMLRVAEPHLCYL